MALLKDQRHEVGCKVSEGAGFAVTIKFRSAILFLVYLTMFYQRHRITASMTG
jgi:hypothetical protein